MRISTYLKYSRTQLLFHRAKFIENKLRKDKYWQKLLKKILGIDKCCQKLLKKY